ncbi:putative phage prohead protease [Selenomonas ruminantium subsp. lactilytica TAM6421]|uniref:Putative phage prohead protease n=1 Tax=Selenomonas ruminantium subsp. lactilytica (strain NBRC 103574 / TAM6421) TaxID=927704 RepID=I0GRZ1_SELRL|nr:HK97 family phage prohead protease [Selenomonas ruminantium]BAL83528.1 putative phage prohead protease [Selenomonas ruminantium subsp. lactilytica TAM6421]
MEKSKRCLRHYEGQEFRAVSNDTGDKVLVGHPVVYERKADIGGWFAEVIERGALDGCDMTDVLFFVNHQQSKIPLARSRRNNGSSTMTLRVDDAGLAMEARLDTENNPDARAVYSAVSRGDMDGMSFAFSVEDEEWEGLDTDYPTRHIRKIARIYEVSAVNEPAYEATDISARDKEALENAKSALENVRSTELEDSDEIEVYKLKNEILSK